MLSVDGRYTSVGEYRGFKIGVRATFASVEFCMVGNSRHTPANLVYHSGDDFSGRGFLNRLDNALKSFENTREDAEETRDREKREHSKALAELELPFPQLGHLQALREDVRDVMKELKIMQGDSNYVSAWQPRTIGAHNATAKAGASETETVREPRKAFEVTRNCP